MTLSPWALFQSVVYRICSEVYREAAGDQAFSEHEPDLIGDRYDAGMIHLARRYDHPAHIL